MKNEDFSNINETVDGTIENIKEEFDNAVTPIKCT